MGKQDGAFSPVACRANNSGYSIVSGSLCRKGMGLLKNQQGFIALHMLTIMLVIIFSVASFLTGMAFSARKNAVMTYGWFVEAMDFAAQAANQDGDITKVSLNTDTAKRYFQQSLNSMTAQANYPGKITVNKFNTVSPGQAIPGGTATAPGYLAEISVPVLGGDVPFIGPQYITVPMRYFAVVKSQRKF